MTVNDPMEFHRLANGSLVNVGSDLALKVGGTWMLSDPRYFSAPSPVDVDELVERAGETVIEILYSAPQSLGPNARVTMANINSVPQGAILFQGGTGVKGIVNVRLKPSPIGHIPYLIERYLMVSENQILEDFEIEKGNWYVYDLG